MPGFMKVIIKSIINNHFKRAAEKPVEKAEKKYKDQRMAFRDIKMENYKKGKIQAREYQMGAQNLIRCCST